MRCCIDTGYLLGLLIPRDELHGTATRLAHELQQQGASYVVTTLVISETLAAVSRAGPWARGQAVAMVRALQSRAEVEVVQFTPDLFERALQLYETRRDKAYSLADCASMVVCRDLAITEVLTADGDFAQEGFTALLLRGE